MPLCSTLVHLTPRRILFLAVPAMHTTYALSQVGINSLTIANNFLYVCAMLCGGGGMTIPDRSAHCYTCTGEPTSITMHMGEKWGGGGGGGRKSHGCHHLTIVLNAMAWPKFSSVSTQGM